MDDTGNFVVSWISNGQDGEGYGIYAQRYDKAAKPLGGEFRVNSYTTGNQFTPSMAMDSDGDFVVAWMSNAQDGSVDGIYAQRFSSMGSPMGAEFRVNTYTFDRQFGPSVAMDSDGDFVIAWMSYAQDGWGYGVYAQRYSNNGAPAGGEFRVNSYTGYNQMYPSVAMDNAGNFVVTWNSAGIGQDGSGSGIYAQRYDYNGNTIGSEFQINTYTTLNQLSPSIAMDSDGDFVVTWESNGQDGSGYGIYAQRYDNTGSATGSEFQVNTYPGGHQRNSAVSMDSAGNFVVTWESNGQDGSGDGIYGQMFDNSGNTIGTEFRINTTTTLDQQYQAVSMDNTGNFVVTWDSYGQDGSMNGVYSKIFFINP